MSLSQQSSSSCFSLSSRLTPSLRTTLAGSTSFSSPPLLNLWPGLRIGGVTMCVTYLIRFRSKLIKIDKPGHSISAPEPPSWVPAVRVRRCGFTDAVRRRAHCLPRRSHPDLRTQRRQTHPLGRSQGVGPRTPGAVQEASGLGAGPEVPEDLGRPPPAGRLSAKGYFLTYSQVGTASEENIHSLIVSFGDRIKSE
jgi:hypothetical protein